MRLRFFRRGAIPRGELVTTATPVYPSPSCPDPSGDPPRPMPETFPRARKDLPCSGCAHSAAGDLYPGMPSGERPCGFCVRNPELDEGEVADWVRERGAVWYDETPAWKTPMDNYIATDRHQQNQIFDALDRIKSGEMTVEKWPVDIGAVFGGPYRRCCDGGGGPSGHSWTCISWRGITFG